MKAEEQDTLPSDQGTLLEDRGTTYIDIYCYNASLKKQCVRGFAAWLP